MFKKTTDTYKVLEQTIETNFKHMIPGINLIGQENYGHTVEKSRQLDTSTRSNDVADDSILLEGEDPYDNQLQLTSSQVSLGGRKQVFYKGAEGIAKVFTTSGSVKDQVSIETSQQSLFSPTRQWPSPFNRQKFIY